MATTRTRLTVSFAAVIVATMIAFAGALLFARQQAYDQELGHEATRVADDVAKVLRDAQASGRPLTYVEQSDFGPVVRGTPALPEILGPRPGFFLVLDSQDKLLFSSSAVRLLSSDDEQSLFDVALQLKLGDQAAIVTVRLDTATSSRILLVARRDPSLAPNISRIVAGLPTNVADLAPRLLLGTMLALFPFVLLVAIGVSYYIAGEAFRPVDQLINEVEAITDGRSLHRRLPADYGSDELSRLATTLNAMLARLESSFGALRRFTADASHELKTPLTVLRADVERAMDPGTARPDRLVALEEALQETARMADLVDSLLTLARADEGRFDIFREPVELEPLVREVYETGLILSEDAGIECTMPLLEPCTVLGDRTRLRQLFLNLTMNAIKYTPRGGQVEISLVRRPHDEAAFTVRDTGIGIAGQDLPHVFERFWRADRVRSRASERGGFGLGLSIAQWIAQAHDGTITVQSRLGRGSIFSIILPVVPAPAAGGRPATEVPHDIAASDRERSAE